MDLFTIGTKAVMEMEGQQVFQYSYKRSNKVKTMTSTHAVKVTKEKGIDTGLLF